jgi:hypothetical protein
MFNYAALIDDGAVEGRDLKDAAAYLYQALRSGNEQVLELLSERPTMFKQGTRRALQRNCPKEPSTKVRSTVSSGPRPSADCAAPTVFLKNEQCRRRLAGVVATGFTSNMQECSL